jgi:two-component system, NarL family, captular synthesis response regulator RcsB
LERCIRVAIVDDHPIVLCGLHRALELAGIEVVIAESSASRLIAMLERYPCDVVITDYSMPGEPMLDGWRFIVSLSTEYPALPVLVYSEFEDPFLIGSLAQRGVSGIVSKRDDISQLFRAVRGLAAGGRYVSPLAHAAIERFGAQPELQRFAMLTRRQMEVAGLMLCGASVCETARLLHRRASTVSAQRTEACRRLGFSRASEVLRFAVGHGLWLDRSSREADSDMRHVCDTAADIGRRSPDARQPFGFAENERI